MLAPVPFLGLVPATAILDAAGYDGAGGDRLRRGALVWIPTRPPGDLVPQLDRRRPGCGTPGGADDQRRGRQRHGDRPCRVRPRRAGRRHARRHRCRRGASRWSRRAPTASPSSRSCATTSRARSAHVTLDGARHAAGRRCGRPPSVVCGTGADRRRGRRHRADHAGDERAVRQGAVHLRARHRLLPGGQARAHRGAAAPGERALAAVLRGVVAGRRARRVPARGQRRAVGSRRPRWTSPRGRTSTCTAASARRGSTTPRCTSAAPSSPAG